MPAKCLNLGSTANCVAFVPPNETNLTQNGLERALEVEQRPLHLGAAAVVADPAARLERRGGRGRSGGRGCGRRRSRPRGRPARCRPAWRSRRRCASCRTGFARPRAGRGCGSRPVSASSRPARRSYRACPRSTRRALGAPRPAGWGTRAPAARRSAPDARRTSSSDI